MHVVTINIIEVGSNSCLSFWWSLLDYSIEVTVGCTQFQHSYNCLGEKQSQRKTSGVPQGREGHWGEGQWMQFFTEQTKDSAAWWIHQLVQASLINLHTPYTCQANVCASFCLCFSTQMAGEIWDKLARKNIICRLKKKKAAKHFLLSLHVQTSPPGVYECRLQTVFRLHGCFWFWLGVVNVKTKKQKQRYIVFNHYWSYFIFREVQTGYTGWFAPNKLGAITFYNLNVQSLWIYKNKKHRFLPVLKCFHLFL